MTKKSTSCSVFGPPRAQHGETAAERERDLGARRTAAAVFAASSDRGEIGLLGLGHARRIPGREPGESFGRRGAAGTLRTMTALVRVAAAGDVHAAEAHRGRLEAAFAALEGSADLVLLAGDLTDARRPGRGRDARGGVTRRRHARRTRCSATTTTTSTGRGGRPTSSRPPGSRCSSARRRSRT